MLAKSPSRRITNLPNPLTPFIGREREIKALSEILHREEVRLLTLTAPVMWAKRGSRQRSMRRSSPHRNDLRMPAYVAERTASITA